MTTSNKNEQESNSKTLGIHFADIDDYNLVLSTIDGVQNEALQKGKKIKRYEALTTIIKEWKSKTA